MFIVYGKYKNCTSKNLFGLLPKGSSFLKKWMFKSMNLNSIIWSQSYNWGGMCKITNEHPCHPKKVRQWCQNKTKHLTPIPPEKLTSNTLKLMVASNDFISFFFDGPFSGNEFVSSIFRAWVPLLGLASNHTSPRIHTAFTDSHNFCWRSKDWGKPPGPKRLEDSWILTPN